MPDSPSQDPGDGAVAPPANQPETFDVESLLSALTKTETGADSLVKALKDRRTRDVLKQRGVKIQADDDVGYNSLPLELRDNIRSFAIVDAQPKDGIPCRCRRCPRLAPYACIDAEWRDAVEAVTFQRLSLKDAGGSITEDLELFERYVVGSRQQYLQYVLLRVDMMRLMFGEDTGEGQESSDEDKAYAFISPVRQLFDCVKQWYEWGTRDGNVHVEIQTKPFVGWVEEPFSVPQEQLQAALTNLPATPQITHLCVSLWDPMDVISVLVLLSNTPNLRSATIILGYVDGSEQDQDYLTQIQLFFDSLPQTVPNLESLEVKCDGGLSANNLYVIFCTAAFSYSQRLRKFSLMDIGLDLLQSILAPFSAGNYSLDPAPPLVWPNLTDFTLGKFHTFRLGEKPYRTLNSLLLLVGRAVRYMPSIQNLDMGLSYNRNTRADSSFGELYCSSEVALNLESPRDSSGHKPVAKLLFTHAMDTNLVEKVPSTKVIKKWKQSLSHAANAILEVQVAFLAQDGGFVSSSIRVAETEHT